MEEKALFPIMFYPIFQLMVQRNYAEAMKLYGYEAQYTQCLRNIREITDKYGISEQSQEETQVESTVS